MLSLCIDTAYKYLTCVLIKDDEILASVSKLCFKRQSEEMFIALNEIFDSANIDRKSIDSICISEGPGSYTGTRIAMTLAKTMGEVLPCDVYTISTLRLYASSMPSTMVIMNARADRAYVGVYNNNDILLEDCVMNIGDIDPKDYNVVGDGALIGKEDYYLDLALAFLKTKSVWKKVEKIAFLVPKYLKESESYLK